jgi:hypothetical protein
MQPEGSQEPTTGLYFWSHESSPHSQTLFPQSPILILSCHLFVGAGLAQAV